MTSQRYDTASKMLHALVLGVPFVGKACFELESMIGQAPPCAQPVFITGLARSGTTLLLELLEGSGQFRSLTYRDMPFILMPSLWSKISSPFHRQHAPHERAHGDGMQIDADSAEAFEEVFWKTFHGREYITATALSPHAPDKAALQRFRQFTGHTLRGHEAKRYLSKNNNNLLRLPSLRAAFPGACILIPFRDPVQHALSLHRQHLLHSHNQDSFSLHYMNWLGHFEFGKNHTPFAFAANIDDTPENAAYWLHYWLKTYGYILSHLPQGAILVDYDALCASPAQAIERICSQIHIAPGTLPERNITPRRHDEPELPQQLKTDAYALHSALKVRAES